MVTLANQYRQQPSQFLSLKQGSLERRLQAGSPKCHQNCLYKKEAERKKRRRQRELQQRGKQEVRDRVDGTTNHGMLAATGRQETRNGFSSRASSGSQSP